jgi:hypothetical protein
VHVGRYGFWRSRASPAGEVSWAYGFGEALTAALCGSHHEPGSAPRF